MEVFAENLKELIIQSSLSLRQLAKVSSVTATQYSRYLKGAIPTIDITLKIAKYFECSLDYLFGLTNVKNATAYTTYDYDLSKFIDNYEKLLQENKTTNYKFIESCGYDESILRHWKNGSVPRLDIIYSIAKKFNCSIDYLIGRY